MISVDKNRISKPTRLDDTWVQDRLLQIKDDDKPGLKVKSRYNDDEVKDALNGLYHHKCAYCEGKANSAQFSVRIEHYRPKNGITYKDEEGKAQYFDNHKGYYWLGYEWTNLMPSCEKCNGRSAKGNHFPLKNESTRISDNIIAEGFFEDETNQFYLEKFDIKELESEERLLLNPEIDKVEEHLYFLPTGEIKHLTEKGEKSIEIYQLNRSGLVLERKRLVDNIIRKLLKIYRQPINTHAILLKNLWEEMIEFSEDREYSRFRFFIKEYFDEFVLSQIRMRGFPSIAREIEEFFESSSS